MTTTTDANAISEAVYNATLTVLDATGPYPVTREQIIDAVRMGVRDAFVEVLGPALAEQTEQVKA